MKSSCNSSYPLGVCPTICLEIYVKELHTSKHNVLPFHFPLVRNFLFKSRFGAISNVSWKRNRMHTTCFQPYHLATSSSSRDVESIMNVFFIPHEYHLVWQCIPSWVFSAIWSILSLMHNKTWFFEVEVVQKWIMVPLWVMFQSSNVTKDSHISTHQDVHLSEWTMAWTINPSWAFEQVSLVWTTSMFGIWIPPPHPSSIKIEGQSIGYLTLMWILSYIPNSYGLQTKLFAGY